jgi:ribosome-associated protein
LDWGLKYFYEDTFFMEKNIHFTLRESEDFITMVQLLKVTQVAGSGGEAQFMVLDGLVKLNGTVDFRKRAKIRKGDIVSARGIEITVE